MVYDSSRALRLRSAGLVPDYPIMITSTKIPIFLYKKRAMSIGFNGYPMVPDYDLVSFVFCLFPL